MSAWKTAVCLAALIAATAHAKPPTQPENEPQQQAASDAETYCKITSVVSHDAILARLEGEKPADTEKRLRQKYAPAARNAESRKLLHAAIGIAVSKAQRTRVPADAKTKLDADTKKSISERIGMEEYRFCMNTLAAKQ